MQLMALVYSAIDGQLRDRRCELSKVPRPEGRTARPAGR